MRPGPLEIIIILLVIMVIVMITRIIRTGQGKVRQNEESSVAIPGKLVRGKKNRAHSFLRRLGVAFVMVGGLLLLAGIIMFRWAFQSYSWAFVLVAVGLALLFFFRKK